MSSTYDFLNTRTNPIIWQIEQLYIRYILFIRPNIGLRAHSTPMVVLL